MKKNYCLMRNGELLRHKHNDLPILFTKEIAMANAKANKNIVALKVGKDIDLCWLKI